MTENRERKTYNDLVADGDVAGARLADDLGRVYAARVPDLAFNHQQDPVRPSLVARMRWWQPAVAAAAALAALAALLVAPSLWTSESEVSAATILGRASDAAESNAPAAGTASYHLIATAESPSEPGSLTTTETWYADPSHLRTETNGTSVDQTPDFGFAVSGDDAWLYGTFDGVLRAAHGPASELGATFGDQSPGDNIAGVLSNYTGSCQTARQDSEEIIAGRTAYKIVVTPDVNACPAKEREPRKEVAKLATLTVWVDKETYLPLKTEQLSGEGGPASYVYTVTSIEVGGDIAESTFAYEAPGGVAVQDVANITEAKNVLSGYSQDGTPPPPPAPQE